MYRCPPALLVKAPMPIASAMFCRGCTSCSLRPELSGVPASHFNYIASEFEEISFYLSFFLSFLILELY